MGGRGATAAGFVDPKDMRWEQVPSSVNSENEIMRYKLIRQKNKTNAKAPDESNKADTVYLVSNSEGKISQIAIYVDHKLTFTIDLDNNKGPHGHIVGPNGRTSHDPGNEYKVPSMYSELVRACAEHNLKLGKRLPVNRNRNLKDIDVWKLMFERKYGKKT
ncbi:MAG: hypothetical protein LUC24_04680 [Bacteroidales bacterium]|nr:hypothetical protein [Bacteroidales bacterium]